MGLGPLNWTSEASAYQGIQQQEFQNQQTATRNASELKSQDLQQQALGLEIQKRQDAMSAQKSFDTLYAKNLATQFDEMQRSQPTKSPHDQESSDVTDLSASIKDRLAQAHAARQSSIDLAKSGDSAGAVLATKNATDLQSGILADSSKLLDLQNKHAEMLSRGLVPVLANGGDQAMYNIWTADQKGRGNNLAAQGLTGDVIKDRPQLTFMQAKGIAVAEQLKTHQEAIKNEQSNILAQSLIESRNNNNAHANTRDAQGQQRIDISRAATENKASDTFKKTSATEIKDQNAIYKDYEHQMNSLNAKLALANTPEGRALIQEQIRLLNKNTKATQKARRETFQPGHGDSVFGKSTSSPVASGADFISKYDSTSR